MPNMSMNNITSHPLLVNAKERVKNLPLARKLPEKHRVWPFAMFGLFLISFVSSFFFFQLTAVKGATEPVGTSKEKAKLGDQVCPLNGAKYSKEDETKWQKRPVLGVMIENHEDAKPQSGLTNADVIYEFVAEGGITRFLALYLCQDADPIGPIRSARTYYLDEISEYPNALYTHVGGAGTPGPADALGQIEKYGIRALNQFNLGFPTFWRDYNRLNRTVATEHTMYSATDKLWEVAEKKFNWGPTDQNGKHWSENFDHWTFVDEAPLEKRGASASATVPFWDRGPGEYRVEWTYDKTQNIYKRDNGGIQHLDNNTKEQLTAKNIAIAFMKESNANDGYPGNVHLLYSTTGTGEAMVLQNGKVIKGTWRKQDRLGRTKFLDAAGNEISFVRGQIWIQIVPIYNKANVEVN